MTFDPTPAAPAPAFPATQKRRSSRFLDIALAAAAVLAVGGIAFAIGRSTAPAANRVGFGPAGAIVQPGGSFDPNVGAGGGPAGVPRFALRGGLTLDGTITALDADGITVKTADGEEMRIDRGGSTAYHQATDASASDVAVGDDVSVKVSAGDGPGGAPTASDAPRLSASDITVSR